MEAEPNSTMMQPPGSEQEEEEEEEKAWICSLGVALFCAWVVLWDVSSTKTRE
jgi:hypothetical protein